MFSSRIETLTTVLPNFARRGAPVSAEDNKALAYRYNNDFHNANDPAVADEVLAPGFVMHLAFPGTPDPMDREGLKGVVAIFHPTSPASSTRSRT